MSAAVLAFPPARDNVVALEPTRSIRKLASLDPRDDDYMPATLALILLQGWHEEVVWYRGRSWLELSDLTLQRIERMTFNPAISAGTRHALETIRDAFARQLREV